MERGDVFCNCRMNKEDLHFKREYRRNNTKAQILEVQNRLSTKFFHAENTEILIRKAV